MPILKRYIRRREIRRRSQKISRWRYMLVWTLRIAPILIAIDLFYIMHIWPDWEKFGTSRIQKSNFIKDYETRRTQNRQLPALHWLPISANHMPRHLRRAVIAAEDARFYSHNGFDLIAFKEAMDTNMELMRFKYGASTISQQTIKNMFFSSSRNPLRKWHELIFTLGMEFKVSKERILTTYLNIAEFGEGIYGVEAAAQYYWHIPADALSEAQAAELAASLPSPRKHNPATRTRRFENRMQKIYYWMQVQNQGQSSYK